MHLPEQPKPVTDRATGVELAHRYFVALPLGQPPNGNRLHARGIAPLSCADPLRRVTSRFGLRWG